MRGRVYSILNAGLDQGPVKGKEGLCDVLPGLSAGENKRCLS